MAVFTFYPLFEFVNDKAPNKFKKTEVKKLRAWCAKQDLKVGYDNGEEGVFISDLPSNARTVQIGSEDAVTKDKQHEAAGKEAAELRTKYKDLIAPGTLQVCFWTEDESLQPFTSNHFANIGSCATSWPACAARFFAI
jgi:hypothetical protein